MKTMKKVLALVLAFALTIGCVVVFANAEGLTQFDGSVMTYSFTVKEGDADSDLYVKSGDSFTLTLKMQTNFYTGFNGKDTIAYTTGVVDAITASNVTLGEVAGHYKTNLNVTTATNSLPEKYRTGYSAILLQRSLDTNYTTPVVYEDPTPVFTVTFHVLDTAEDGSTVTFVMPPEVVGSQSVNGRAAVINQYVINNTTSAAAAADVAEKYTQTVNLPEALTITVGEPPVSVDKTALKTAIDTLPAIGQDEATSASWSAYTDALAAGQAVYDKADATQEEVDAAKDALIAATNGVTKLGDCNYTELDAAISAYEALDLEAYTPNSVTNSDVTAKYDAAKAVTRDMLADEAGENQGSINDAAAALNNAIAALVLKADKTALAQAIADAEAKNEADYTPNSWTAAGLAGAISAAQTVYNDANASVDEVAGQVTALSDAIAALVLKADKTALAAAISTLPAVAQAEATSASWADYEAALAAANDVYADDNATQTAVDDAKDALIAATAAVARLAACDYTNLDSAITAYEALDLSAFTPASVTASDVTAKYDAAKDVTRDLLNDEQGVNQTAIEAAATALNNAVALLVEKADKTPLINAIADAQGKAEADYTPNSWTEADLANVIAAAQVVVADDNALADDVSAQVTAIEEAVAKLVLKADKAALAEAITAASQKNEADYTPASWTDADLANEITAAQNVYDDDNATEQQVADAIAALSAAVQKLAAKANKEALAAAIATLPAVAQAEATSATWTAYADALTAANEVYADDNAAQDAVDTAANNLMAAIDGVTRLSDCDYTALDAAIAAYDALTLANYTPASVTDSDVTAKYDAAKAVTRDMLADEAGENQGSINDAADALNNAIAALVLKADKTALAEAIAAAQSKAEADYTPASWTEADLAAAIQNGQTVYDDDNATAQAISEQITAINTAIGKLVAKADKTALAVAISTLPEVAQTEATSASWADYEAALAAANEVYADDNATQTAVDNAKDALVEATAAVARLAACDYTALNEAIAAYEALDFSAYTPASVTASDVTAKYAAAGEVEADMLADEQGTNQATINAAADALNAAINALVAKGDKTELIAEIAAAPAMDEDTATEESWDAYQAELVAAQAVVDDENADQTAVDNEKAALVAAKELVARDLCDYTALDAALALVPEKEADEYTETTWNAYAAAKAAAEQVAKDLVNNKAGTNQKIVDDAAAALALAYSRLRGNGCSITSFTATQEHYMRNDMVTFAFVVKGQNYAKIQVLHDGATLTYDRDNAAVVDIVPNEDGTETWNINIKIYNDGEFTYSARAKAFNAAGGWDNDYIDFNGETSTGDDAEVKSAAAILNGEEVTAFTTNDLVTLRVVAGEDTRRVRFTDTTRGLTMTMSTPKSVNEDGTKVFEVTRKLGEARDYTYAIDTADSTNQWTRAEETVSVSVTKYVAPQIIPSTGNMDDAVISVDAGARVLRFQAQTFTVVTDKNASGFRLVDSKGNAIATQKTGGVTEGDQTTWTMTKYYSAIGTFTYTVQALYGKTWIDSGKTVTFTVAY